MITIELRGIFQDPDKNSTRAAHEYVLFRINMAPKKKGSESMET